ncbi:MAG: MarR family transcriptional regulator [Ruminococcaceae bacterium]|nr:MarR family transcriptional regulator [Oscillospiraceae bacterium]
MKPLKLDIDGVLGSKSYDIILAILRSRGITRKELADVCGVSTVTVGKVVSAMLAAGYATAESDTSAPNKRAELITPAADLAALIIKGSRRKLGLFLCDICGDIILSRSKNINDSLPVEEDIIRLISSAQDELKGYVGERCGTVILCDDGAAKPDIRAISLAIPALSPDIVLPSRDCTEKYINRVYPNDTTLFVCLGEVLDIRLFSEGRTIKSNLSAPPRIEQNDERSVISHLARTVSSLFNITLPRRIIIESEYLPFDDRALDMLREEIKLNTPLRREGLPEIITNTAPSLDVSEAVDMVRKKFADIRLQ